MDYSNQECNPYKKRTHYDMSIYEGMNSFNSSDMYLTDPFSSFRNLPFVKRKILGID